MGVYDRNHDVPGAKSNLWISYSVTEVLRIKYGLPKRRVREPAPADNQRAAQALIAQRRREIRDGSWTPRAVEVTKGRLVGDYIRWWIAHREQSGVRSVKNERQRLRDHVLPVLGDKLLTEVTRKDVCELIQNLQRQPSKKSRKMLAPRTVHRVYEDLRTMYAYAVEVDEIVPATPCTLKVARGELPKKKDRDPRWRAGAIYDRDEVELLISSDVVPWPRRVTYALMFLLGVRVGEAVGRRWRDYDTGAKPLKRMSIETQYDDEELKKENPRATPVHQVLEQILAHWRREGFPLFFGRAPTRDDFIVPKQRGKGCQSEKRVWHNLQKDLGALGLRRRRSHDMRRTLVTLARADGARDDLLKWVTHGPTESMMDLYTTPPWATLCAQIACLNIELRKPATVTPIRRLDRA
jgi:integrase